MIKAKDFTLGQIRRICDKNKCGADCPLWFSWCMFADIPCTWNLEWEFPDELAKEEDDAE